MRKIQVLHIFVAPSAGEPMKEVRKVTALAGVGLSGDRYAKGTGAFSKNIKETKWQATLISHEAIEDVSAMLAHELLPPFLPSETRRNIVVEGITAEELRALVGKIFKTGEVSMRGVEECIPCERPSKLSHKQWFKVMFKNRGGLCVEILTDGTIKAGDCVSKF